MSKLERNYNWNGEYILLKELEKRRFKISTLDYSESFYIFIEDGNRLRYSIIDDNFGMPTLANTMDTEHSLNLRTRCVEILDKLVEDKFIQKVE